MCVVVGDVDVAVGVVVVVDVVRLVGLFAVAVVVTC